MSDLELSMGAPIKERNQCKAHKKNGERCQKAPIAGATVCRFHGGAAPHVRAAARARLENAADRLAKELLGMATSPDMTPAVKLAALNSALDRAGITAKQAMAITHELKPYEKLFEKMDRTSVVSESAPAPTVIDGEIVSTDDYAAFDDGRSA